MSKSIDLGKKLSDTISVEEIDPDKPRYPDLFIADTDDERIAQMPDKGTATIKYRVLSRVHREEKHGSGKNHSCSLRLEIISIDPPESKKKNNEYGVGARKAVSDYFKDK